ncbi:MAG TPA: O-antigen ligase family protein [Flavobacteriales bacterium]|nr:O-antigen ligase family protein [Flavobacteriales bacterium]
MREFFSRNYQLVILILIYILVGVYARPFLYVLMPFSVFFIKSRDLWPDMIFGLIMVLVLSDITPWFFKMQVFKGAKNTYITALSVIFLLERYRFVPFSKVFNVFLPFFIYSFFPLVFSNNLVVGLQKTISYALLYLIVPNYVLYNFRLIGWDFFRNLVKFMAVILLSGYFVLWFHGEFYAFMIGRFRGLFGNPNGMALFCVLLIMVSVTASSINDQLLSWKEKIFVYGTATYFLIISGSRASLVAVLIFLVFGRFFSASPVFGFMALLAVFGLSELVLSNIAPIVTAFGLEDYVRLQTLESGSGRYFAWDFAWKHIQDYFVFGGGFANDERIMRKHRLYLERMGHQGGVHNSYLSFWFNVGIVGLVLFLRSFILIFVKASKLVPFSLGVMFAVMFSITYESWLVSSLNPFTIILLIIITMVTEEEIVRWDEDSEENQAPEEEQEVDLQPVRQVS